MIMNEDRSLTVKNKIDPIWQCFYNENMAQTSDIVNQLTTLMFIKMLDDKQNNKEANALLMSLSEISIGLHN